MATEERELALAFQSFQELQAKFVKISSNHRTVMQQLAVVARKGRVATITREELQAMPSNTATYEPTGKAFFLTPKQEAVEWLNSTIDECVVNQKQMLDSKEALEKQVKATEGEMRELLEHSPTLARAIASNTSD